MYVALVFLHWEVTQGLELRAYIPSVVGSNPTFPTIRLELASYSEFFLCQKESDIMNELTYRVYQNYKGWELIGNKSDLKEVVSLIEGKMIKQPKAYYLIIEHNYLRDEDIPYRSVRGIEDLLILKDEIVNKPKKLSKRR